MIVTRITQDYEKFDAIKRVVKLLERTVLRSMGPLGESMVISKLGDDVRETKDGIRILNAIRVSDPVEAAILTMIRDAVQRSVDQCGDGTTTTTAMICEMINYYSKGMSRDLTKSFRSIGKDMLTSIEEVLIEISRTPTDEDYVNILKTASNGDEDITRHVLGMMREVGELGSVALKTAIGNETSIEVELSEGFKLDSGYSNPSIVNTPDGRYIKDDEVIYIHNGILTVDSDLDPIAKMCNGKTCTLFCRGIDDNAYAILVQTIQDTDFNIIRVEGYGQTQLDNLADLESYIDHDGVINIETTNSSTTITSVGSNPELPTYIESLSGAIKAEKDPYKLSVLQKRVARLTGNLATIIVSDYTTARVKERYDRVEDAIGAWRSASKMGVMTGASVGSTHDLVYAPYNTDSHLQYSYLRCMMNAALIANDTVLSNYPNKLSTTDFNKIKDDGKVLDSTMVIITALRNAYSCVETLLTSGEIIVEVRDGL